MALSDVRVTQEFSPDDYERLYRRVSSQRASDPHLGAPAREGGLSPNTDGERRNRRRWWFVGAVFADKPSAQRLPSIPELPESPPS